MVTAEITRKSDAIRSMETPLEEFRSLEYVRSESFAQLDRQFEKESVEELCTIEPIETELREVSLKTVETGLSTYLAELHKVPLLEGDEEYDIFQWMNYLTYRAAKKLEGQQRISHKLEQDVTRLLRRSRQIRNQIVSANLRLVVSIAKKLMDRHNSLEELISDGHLPLIRAVEIFDFERGTRFSTYATWAIRNKLFRSTPRNRKHARRFQNGSDDFFPLIPDETHFERSFESYHREIQETVEGLLEQLDERDQHIVKARFGLNAENQPHRFREIAERLDISTERVRQLLARSIERLKEHQDQIPVDVA
ncbi:MAG: sigma-70 family RNA polymerase sigma factor [Planctomycetaceae bacterium]|nr:sigma-70 family RNA polymerase sigma factor [Planctomycetaceae bacterium]